MVHRYSGSLVTPQLAQPTRLCEIFLEPSDMTAVQVFGQTVEKQALLEKNWLQAVLAQSRQATGMPPNASRGF